MKQPDSKMIKQIVDFCEEDFFIQENPMESTVELMEMMGLI